MRLNLVDLKWDKVIKEGKGRGEKERKERKLPSAMTLKHTSSMWSMWSMNYFSKFGWIFRT